LQADGAEILTVESLAEPEGPLNPIQQAFHESHALQCGYCTPGFLMVTTQLLADNPDPSDSEIRAALAGNLCRCTGYVNIIRAVKLAAEKLRKAAR
jgi:carbon-monoxide dehydrogenase small subunit